MIPYQPDIDRDGVPDHLDCSPWNPLKQHIRPSEVMKERLKKLPIYVTDEPLEKNNLYHILSKNAEKFAPNAVREFFGMIKWHPGVVVDIERYKPDMYIYSSFLHKSVVRKKEHEEGWMEQEKIYIRKSSIYPSKGKEEVRKKAWQVYKSYPDAQKEYAEKFKRTPFLDESISTIADKQKRSGVETSFHELGHLQHKREIGFRYGFLRVEEITSGKREFLWETETRTRKHAGKKLKEREQKRILSPKAYRKILGLK